MRGTRDSKDELMDLAQEVLVRTRDEGDAIQAVAMRGVPRDYAAAIVRETADHPITKIILSRNPA